MIAKDEESQYRSYLLFRILFCHLFRACKMAKIMVICLLVESKLTERHLVDTATTTRNLVDNRFSTLSE